MTVSLEESRSWCRSLAKRTAKNFYFSFLTLPAVPFRDMCVLYAFMRLTDDIGDEESQEVPHRLERLGAWRESLSAALREDRFDCEVFPALAEIIRRHGIPHEYLFAVLEGVEADLNFPPEGFETFEELSRYCYQVAGAVGLCCIHIWGYRDERAKERAVDCGMAFQLTNILRDLGEDVARGRVYLPAEDLQRFDFTPEEIGSHCRDERFAALMEFEVGRAREYYRRAEELFEYLEAPGRPIYASMLQIYGGLLEQIEQKGYDVYNGRIQLPHWRKLMISFDAVIRHRWLGRR